MMEVLVYIFSSFWRWLGAAIMLGIIFEGIGSIFRGMIIKGIMNKEKKIDEQDR